jgi:hypothetical protein
MSLDESSYPGIGQLSNAANECLFLEPRPTPLGLLGQVSKDSILRELSMAELWGYRVGPELYGSVNCVTEYASTNGR